MHGTDGVSDETLRFIQSSQCIAGWWTAWSDPCGMVPSVWELFRRVPHCCGRERGVVVFVVSLLAERLTGAVGSAARTVHTRDHCARALAIVAAEYSNQDLDLAHLARRVGLSRCHLSHLMRSGTGHPLPVHVNGFRIARAALLLSQDIPVKSIAFDVGYRCTGELDRQFARWWRMSPIEFRRVLPEASRLRRIRESALAPQGRKIPELLFGSTSAPRVLESA